MIFSNRFSQPIEVDDRLKNGFATVRKLNANAQTYETNTLKRACTEINIALPIGKEKNGSKFNK
jgi:hypothetical protein